MKWYLQWMKIFLFLLATANSVKTKIKNKRYYRQHSSDEIQTSSTTDSRTKVSSEFMFLSEDYPSEFQPITKGDSTLINLIRRYVIELYPKGLAEERSLKSLLLNSQGETPFRTKTRTQAWFPIECINLDFNLRKVSTIHDGRRNLVLKFLDRKTNQLYVWKRYENPDEYTTEVGFFMLASHPNIVKPVCVQQDAKTGLPGLLIEFIKGGSSIDFAHKNAHNPKVLQRLCAQMYDVLKYMHWLGFVHADFKPENMMVDEKGNAIAIDFGFAIPIPLGRYYRGTPNTIAPELVKAVKGPILENIDTWALGSTIAQFYGRNLLGKLSSGSKRGHRWCPTRICPTNGYMFGTVPTIFSQNLKQLLYFTMNPNPYMRMLNTLSQLEWFESLPFWKGIDFDTIGFNWTAVKT